MLEKFQVTISPQPVVRSTSCFVLGGVFGDGGSNGAIFDSNKFKMAPPSWIIFAMSCSRLSTGIVRKFTHHQGRLWEEARMPNGRNAKLLLLLLMTFIGRKLRHAANAPNDEISQVRAECRILAVTVVIKQTKSCISLLLSPCGASVYSQYNKIRLDILCKNCRVVILES